MKIGQRNCLIFNEIITHRSTVTGKSLETGLHLTRKQVEYGINRINEYLEEQELPALKRLSNGRILVADEVVKQVDLEWLDMENQEIWLSKVERRQLIQLMLLTKRQELSLQHFIAELKASKNTVLTDLKYVREQLAPAGIELTHSREAGYQLEGEEYDLRQQLFTVLRNMISKYNHLALVTAVGAVTRGQLEHMRRITERIEAELKTRFTDEMAEVNGCFLTILFRRIQNGMILNTVPEALWHVTGTKEYMVIKAILADEGIKHINEVMYITAHIQSMKINMHLVEVVEQQKVSQAVAETIRNFERIACVYFKDKENLFSLLLNHSVPALHRILYNFHVGPDITDFVLPAYQEVHNMVKKSVGPLEKLIGMSFPEKELVYITLIFIAQTSRGEEEGKTERRIQAVVVCQNGITVSHFLLTTLERTFPEIDFITYLSVRQFYDYKGTFDVVFTTVPLQTPHKQFVIDTFMDEEKRKQLRKTVYESLKNKEELFPQIDTILQIVKKHTNEGVFQKLRQELDSYLTQPEEPAAAKSKPELRELLTRSNIRIINESMGWKEAIEFAAVPLLYQNVIRYQYVETIIADIMERQQIMLVADQVMIAHAGIDAGVYDVGLSLLLLPKTIMVNDYMEVKVLFVLATPDYEQHLTALNQLIDILEDETKLAAIKEAVTADDILALL